MRRQRKDAKCLEKNRGRRYETASALAADVQRHLNDESVLACPPSAIHRFGKFARRHKAALAMSCVVGLAAVVMVSVISTSLMTTRLAQKATRYESYLHLITLAHRDLAFDRLEECPKELRDWEWNYLMRLCKAEPLVIRDMREVNGVAFSPDGKWLASAGGDGTVKIRNSRTRALLKTLPAHTDSAGCVVFHPDGEHVASTGADGRVKVWDLETEQHVFDEPCDAVRKFGSAYTVAFSPDGRLLAAGSGGEMRVWDWKNREVWHSFPRHKYHSIPVTFSHDGRWLATRGALGGGPTLWDMQRTISRCIEGNGNRRSACPALAVSLP